MVDLRTGINGSGIKLNFDEFASKWLDYKLVNEGRSRGTIEKYRRCLCLLQSFLASAHTTLLAANSVQLVQFAGLHLHKLGYTPRSRRVAIAAIRGFYGWLTQNNVIAVNPALSLEYPKVGKKLPVAMSLETAEQLIMQPDIQELVGVRDAAIMSLMIGGGFRVSGVCALNESNLYWYQHNNKQRLAIKVQEKGNKERIVPIPVEAMFLLQAYLGHRDLTHIDRWLENGDRVLFVTTHNRRMPQHDYIGEERRISSRTIDKFIKKYALQANVPFTEAHAHAMRHLLGTELAEESASTLEIQAVLGHADPKTSEIYTKLAFRKLTQVIDKANPFQKLQTPISQLAKEYHG